MVARNEGLYDEIYNKYTGESQPLYEFDQLMTRDLFSKGSLGYELFPEELEGRWRPLVWGADVSEFNIISISDDPSYAQKLNRSAKGLLLSGELDSFRGRNGGYISLVQLLSLNADEFSQDAQERMELFFEQLLYGPEGMLMWDVFRERPSIPPLELDYLRRLRTMDRLLNTFSVSKGDSMKRLDIILNAYGFRNGIMPIISSIMTLNPNTASPLSSSIVLSQYYKGISTIRSPRFFDENKVLFGPKEGSLAYALDSPWLMIEKINKTFRFEDLPYRKFWVNFVLNNKVGRDLLYDAECIMTIYDSGSLGKNTISLVQLLSLNEERLTDLFTQFEASRNVATKAPALSSKLFPLLKGYILENTRDYVPDPDRLFVGVSRYMI